MEKFKVLRRVILALVVLSVCLFIISNHVWAGKGTDEIFVEECSNLPVRRAGESYSAIQDAYNAAVDGDTILSQAVVFSENPDFNRNISLTITGGYDCDYSTNVQKSVVNGTITIRNGTVVLENIKIR